LGIERVEFLGYGDSGYPEVSIANADTDVARGRTVESGTLAAAVVDGAARDVRRILVEERAVALTSYDANGIYGHIDHVRVHEIAEQSVVGTDCELYEATISRAELRRLRGVMVERGLLQGVWPLALTEQLGVEEGPDVVAVDVSEHLTAKLSAVSAHASQVLAAPTFMGLPPGAFHHLLGTEWFRVVRPGSARFLHVIESVRTSQSAAGPSTAADQPIELAAAS
jgi:LmbE family N-acetylglucosaminyl deacetylase